MCLSKQELFVKLVKGMEIQFDKYRCHFYLPGQKMYTSGSVIHNYLSQSPVYQCSSYFKSVSNLFPHPMFPHSSSLSPVYFHISVSPILQVCHQSISPSMFPQSYKSVTSLFPHQCLPNPSSLSPVLFPINVSPILQVCHQSIFLSMFPNLRIMIQRDSSICFY